MDLLTTKQALQPVAGAHQSPPRQTPLGTLATLALVATGAQRLLLGAIGVLEASLVATQASVNPTSPSTRTGMGVLLLLVTMGVASKLASLQLSATCVNEGLSCGNTGHFARDCPEPRKQSGDCFNCGQPG